MSKKAKQRPNLLKLAAQELDAKVVVPGDDRRISKRELGVIRLVNRFMETGDPKIFMAFVEILHQGGGPEIIYRSPSTDVTEWTDNEVFEVVMQLWEQCAPAARENEDETE